MKLRNIKSKIFGLNRFCILLVAMLIIPVSVVVLYGSVGRGASSKPVILYCCRGYDTGSYIPNEKYQNFIKAIFKNKTVIFDNQPSKARIFDMLKQCSIFYANIHSGYPSHPEDGVQEHIMQVGESSGADYKITALDLAQLRRQVGVDNLPDLIVISGCSIMAGPKEGGRVLTIPEGFGVTSKSEKRAVLGLASLIPGYRGDGYFRVFFARWANPQPDGSYLTLQQANQSAIQYIRDWTSRHGNNDAVYMNALNAEVGEKLVILGDSSLRFSDLH